jgi:hypothetical protein
MLKKERERWVAARRDKAAWGIQMFYRQYKVRMRVKYVATIITLCWLQLFAFFLLALVF